MYLFHNDSKRHEQFIFSETNVGGENEREKQGNHPTPKPIELIYKIIKDIKAETILDLFLGSGSTLIAAHKLNRVCYGMEISPAYVDVVCARWGKFTGEQAVRESDGFRFPVSVSDGNSHSELIQQKVE
jgi:DNA modification methylase